METFHADLIRDHFVITDNGRRVFLDTGCPFIITEENQDRIPFGRLFLADARRNVSPDIAEFRGMAYFAQHKIVLDYQNALVVVADPSENIPMDTVAEFTLQENRDPRFPPNAAGIDRVIFTMNIGGTDRKMIFDTGASITDYIRESIAKTGPYFDTIRDFNPHLGKYSVDRHALSAQIGNDIFDIPFGIQPAPVDAEVSSVGANGVIGVGLYKKYKVLVDLQGRKMVIGR
ncbi:MAG: hypothetical protein IKZ45_04965 [Fibrobacter sp.]|nr:hypothetical protein [Fibrobacter sp.]